MTFEEFLSKRLPDLLRFAIVLCGSRELSSELTATALSRSRSRWDAIVAAGAPFAAIRATIVRGYLSGATHAVDVTVLDEAALADEIRAHEWDRLANRFRSLSKRQRAVVCLRYYSGLAEAETAGAVGTGLSGVQGDLARARIALSIRGGETAARAPAGQTVEALEGFLELISEVTVVDAEAVLERVGAGATPDPAATERDGAAEMVDDEAADDQAEDEVAEDEVAEDEVAEDEVAETTPSTAADPPAADPPEQPVNHPPARSEKRARRKRPEPADLAADLLLAVAEQSAAGESARMLPRGSVPPGLRIDETDAPAESTAAPGDDRTESQRPRLWPRVAMVGAVAAVGLFVVALLVVSGDSNGAGGAAQPDSSSSGAQRSSPPTGPALPSPVGHLLPGSTVVGEYSGIGPSTVHPPAHELAAGHELAIRAVCQGGGFADVGPVHVPTCTNTPVGAVFAEADAGALEITAAEGTRWRIAVIDQPKRETNGALQYPAASVLGVPNPPDLLGARSGTGSANVSLARAVDGLPAAAVRVFLRCRGTGVTLSSSDGRFNGNYTRTCFPGWSYEFDIAQTSLPGTVHVAAAPRTTWRLVVVGQ